MRALAFVASRLQRVSPDLFDAVCAGELSATQTRHEPPVRRVGKSTLATAFAVYLHDAVRRVAVLDAVEQLHSARAIAEAEPTITVVAEFEPNKVPDTIPQLAAQHDDVVCDAPARFSDETRAMMVMTDVAIFPMEPTIKCLRSTKESIEVLNYARTVTNGKLRTNEPLTRGDLDDLERIFNDNQKRFRFSVEIDRHDAVMTSDRRIVSARRMNCVRKIKIKIRPVGNGATKNESPYRGTSLQ